jgi:hypothetical protein
MKNIERLSNKAVEKAYEELVAQMVLASDVYEEDMEETEVLTIEEKRQFLIDYYAE